VGLIGSARWPGVLPPAPPRWPPRPPADGESRRPFEFLHVPEPEMVAGRPRVVRGVLNKRYDVGTLNFASTGTAIMAFLILVTTGGLAFHANRYAGEYAVLVLALLAGVVTGRARWRGKFTAVPGVFVGVLPAAGVELVAVLIGALTGFPEALMLSGPCVWLFVTGLDWTWAQRLRWMALGSLLFAGESVLSNRPALPLLAALVVMTATFLWSAQTDITKGSRSLLPLSGFVVPSDGDDEPRVEITLSLLLAVLFTLLLVPLFFIPSFSWDFRAPSVDWQNPFGPLLERLLAWLESLFGDTPNLEPLELPEWLKTIFGWVRDIRRAVAPVILWLLPKLPYVIVAVIIALLVRRTIRSYQRWQAKLDARRWGARLSDQIFTIGRSHGERRRKNETVQSFAHRLIGTAVPDDRLLAVAELATESCFAAHEVDAARQQWGDDTLREIRAAHPPRRRARLRLRRGRTSSLAR
jgi:hypothetical protein